MARILSARFIALTVGNGPDHSARQPIYCKAGALLPPQTSNPEGSLPREQSLRSAPSGRNSEQGLAPRSKYSRRMPQNILGTARVQVARHRRDERGITKNPEGNFLLMREVSPQVTEGEKSYPLNSASN